MAAPIAEKTTPEASQQQQHYNYHQPQRHDDYREEIDYYPIYGTTVSGTSEIVEEGEHEDNDSASELFEIADLHGGQGRGRRAALSEIKEESEGSLFSFHVNGDGSEDCVYVAVGAKSETSVDALAWALNNVDKSRTTVFLVHVFPETRFIPSPLGNLPISGVSEQQAEAFKAQERGKMGELLQKYLNTCLSSKVKVDTVLIESDMVAKAILDLVPVLNIRKLVVGTAKSNLRRLRSKKGNGIVDQILQKAPETCEVKVICEGKEVIFDQTPESPSTTPSHGNHPDESKTMQEGNQRGEIFSCSCFKPRTA